MKPHKWAKEIHAIADGIEVQWAWESRKLWSDWDREYDASPITSREGIVWRIKPPEVAQWRKTMAKALEDGKVVEHLNKYGWNESFYTSENFLNPDWKFEGEEYYRIRPEPDFFGYCFLDQMRVSSVRYANSNFKVIFDGETGKPISAEVL